MSGKSSSSTFPDVLVYLVLASMVVFIIAAGPLQKLFLKETRYYS